MVRFDTLSVCATVMRIAKFASMMLADGALVERLFQLEIR
jgi:hypothetical protein